MKSLPPVIAALVMLASTALTGAAELPLELQRRVPDGAEGRWRIENRVVTLDPARVGIVAVDMWNWHWCKTSAARVGAMVPRMNAVLAAAREMGIQVFLCPTDVVDNYAGWPQRERTVLMETLPMPTPTALECPTAPDGGGCTCGKERCRGNYGWNGMHPDLVIDERDLMPNNPAALYTLCKERGIDTLIYMGVHTQVCLLGKSIGVRPMLELGFNCILARDLTDAHGLYDPVKGVTPDDYTQMVVEHFEKYLVPTVNFHEAMVKAGKVSGGTAVDVVRFAPWGKVERPHLFEEQLIVALTEPWHEGAAIHYTLDGSEPTARSPRYEGALTIRESTHIRAAAFRDGRAVTLPSQAYYAKLGAMPPPPEVHLSDLTPLRIVGPGHSASDSDHRFAPVSQRPQIDKSNRGQPLRLRGIVYERGMGAHAPNQMIYAIEPGYARFVALAGVDEHIVDVNHASDLGMIPSVVFRVFIDGELAAESPVMKIQEEPWRFDVPIPAGAKRISLCAVPTADGNREDLANWVNAGFVRR